MPYVVAAPCIGVKDTACVAVCPVDCIHPTSTEPGFSETPQLYIDPEVCIGCGLCAGECPANAIFPVDDVPAEWEEYIERNRAHFHPVKA